MTETQTVSTQSGWRIRRDSISDHSTVQFQRSSNARVQTGKQNRVVRAAVFDHIKALRKLGQTRVNTRDIAIALNLPRPLVEQAVAQLKDEGVKVAK